MIHCKGLKIENLPENQVYVQGTQRKKVSMVQSIRNMRLENHRQANCYAISEQPLPRVDDRRSSVTPEMTRRYVSLDHSTFDDLYTIIRCQEESLDGNCQYEQKIKSTKIQRPLLPKLSERRHTISVENFQLKSDNSEDTEDIKNQQFLLGTSPKSTLTAKESPTLPRLSSEKKDNSRRYSNCGDNKLRLPLSTIANDQNTSNINYKREDIKKDILLSSRIKDFMTKEIPGKPPSSLRYHVPKNASDEKKTKSVPVKASNLPINTNSCPNLHLHSDRSRWSYTHKPGKCRYLRCPPSPILQPDEIFAE